jgi:formate dehydrogenase major subunit
VPGLGTSFGRGGATTAQQDLANADCILIEGSSMAEAHPVGFRWVVAAKERGATIIHVDPRFSRTSALADIWVPIRAGGDLAFLGGLVRHVIDNGLFFREYVIHYTNAACLLKEEYRDAEDLDGFFSGWNAAAGSYDTASWRYEGDDLGRPRKDPALEHPRCVLQVLKRHFARYTPEAVERAAGVPPELFHRVADALTRNSGPERTAAICYAVGWTQHSKGVQIIRAAAILQLLLGNIGRPGGGILALRGHASIQGSTDIPTLYDILPGYLPMPRAGRGERRLRGWLEHHVRETGGWHALEAYAVSLLKAYYGARAARENDWGFGWLPRLTRDHSHFSYWTEMADGRVEGLFIMGQNPSVGAQNARLERRALARLRWLVVRDMVEIEPAVFWRDDSPEVRRGELDPTRIPTETFLMPAAGHAEKAGSFTQTQRMLQWREKAVEPPGDARSEAWFVHQLALRLRARALASDDPRDEPLRALDWWYPEDEHGEPVMEAVLAEINGWRVEPRDDAGDDGRAGHEGADSSAAILGALDRYGRRHHGPQVGGFAELAADGSTACGCWIYSGVYGPDGVNRALRREPAGPYGHGWGYTWPSDRRILYNRASARPDGRPWSERKRLVWWDEARAEWTGYDVPDFPREKRPGHRPAEGARGMDAIAGDAPFIMHEDGLGWIFVPQGLNDGPLPTHYEPLESPLQNPLYGQQSNPAARWYRRADNPYAPPGDPRFPHVLTTYRLTEHHTAGGMSRTLSHLSELQPELFAEISPEHAAEIGVVNGDWITVATLRGAVEARAMVTRRMRPLHLDGRPLHQVAMPFHWGPTGPNKGDVVNDLIPISGEPNVTIHEGKALVCAVLPGRRPPDEELDAWLERTLGADVASPRARDEERPAHPGSDPAAGRGTSETLGGGHGEEGKA